MVVALGDRSRCPYCAAHPGYAFEPEADSEFGHGLIAGYTDVDSYYHWLTSWSTHHLAYGRLDPSGILLAIA